MRSLRLVPPLPPGIMGDEGVIGKDSIVWGVAGYRLVVLGGISALLLQVGHPLVAAGVAEHSEFEDDPLKRLIGTLQATLVTTFGDHRQAAAAATAVRQIHGGVQGVLDETRGEWPAGTPYSANDPELCLWVFAPLVVKALEAFKAFGWELDIDEQAQYYEASKPFARMYGVTPELLPVTYSDFRAYYRQMLERLVIDGRAKAIARSIFASRLYGLPVSPLGQVITAGLLEAPIREAYELDWGRATRVAWFASRNAVRQASRLAPSRMRYWQHYHQAVARVAT